jgi:hypothetical protein
MKYFVTITFLLLNSCIRHEYIIRVETAQLTPPMLQYENYEYK